MNIFRLFNSYAIGLTPVDQYHLYDGAEYNPDKSNAWPTRMVHKVLGVKKVEGSQSSSKISVSLIRYILMVFTVLMAIYSLVIYLTAVITVPDIETRSGVLHIASNCVFVFFIVVSVIGPYSSGYNLSM